MPHMHGPFAGLSSFFPYDEVDRNFNVQLVVCFLIYFLFRLDLQVQVPTSGSETIECGVCQHPFLVSAH